MNPNDIFLINGNEITSKNIKNLIVTAQLSTIAVAIKKFIIALQHYPMILTIGLAVFFFVKDFSKEQGNKIHNGVVFSLCGFMKYFL